MRPASSCTTALPTPTATSISGPRSTRSSRTSSSRPAAWPGSTRPTCRTALANAEVEHDPEHRSIAIHVRFPIAADARSVALRIPADAAMLAWTTTPWTIPANVATAVHPDLEYVLVGGDARHAVI